MADDDKPFACEVPECGMRFTNEDRLTVHKQKHEMALQLDTQTKETNKLLFVDQTPTPTKFLKNCEELGIFLELKSNPFEESFKKAVDGEGNEVAPLPGPGDMETPVVTKLFSRDIAGHRTPSKLAAPLEPSLGRSPRQKPNPPALNEDEPVDLSPMSSSPRKNLISTSTTTITTHPTKPSPLSLNKPSPAQRPTTLNFLERRTSTLSSATSQLSVDSSSAASTPSSAVGNITPGRPPSVGVPVPVVTSQPPGIVPLNIPTVPTQQAAAAPMIPTTTLMRDASGSSFTTMQVLLQLPGGAAIPVQIPAAITNPAVPVPQAIPATSVPTASMVQPVQPVPIATQAAPVTVTTTSSVSSTTSLTKQRLKQALTQNVSQNVLQNNMRVMSEAVDVVTGQTPSPTSSGTSSQPMSPEVHTTVVSNKRRSESIDESPDEKRRKFLERNRAAAARCRDKRRVYINSLEKRAEDLQNTNLKLQNECATLRNEVATLKSLLLAHKDCPIMKEQQEKGLFTLAAVKPGPEMVTIEEVDSSTMKVVGAMQTSGNVLTSESISQQAKQTVTVANEIPRIKRQ